MHKLEMSKIRIERLSAENQYYNFPDYIVNLRKALGVTRQVMADDLEIDYMKLFYIESGKGVFVLPDPLLDRISNYFGVPFSTLKTKAEKYYPKNKEKTDE